MSEEVMLDVLQAPSAVQQPGVASHQVLRIDMDGAGRSLMVLSGIACPEFQGTSSAARRVTCRIRLREPAQFVEQTTVHLGLASISTDSDDAWSFATEAAAVQTNADTGELELVAQLVVATEHSYLHRFSYQVVVIEHQVTTEISGALTWATSMLRPATADPTALAGVFEIWANTVTQMPGQPGPLFPPPPQLTHLIAGEITGLQVGDQVCSATYRITGLPLGGLLRVTVDQHGLQPSSTEMGVTAAGNDQMTLTIAAPTKTGVDFKAGTGPRVS